MSAQIRILRNGTPEYVLDFETENNFRTTPFFAQACRQFSNRTAEYAKQVSAALRKIGLDAIAVTSIGGQLEDPQSAASPAAVSEEIDWHEMDSLFPGVRIAPTKVSEGKYVYRFTDPKSEVNHSVAGASRQEVIDRLMIPHPAYVEHLQSLPRVQPAPQINAVPETQSTAPRKVLRHGSQTELGYRHGELPERRVQSVDPFAAKRAEMTQFARECSVAQLKHRLKTDPEFARFYNE